MIKRTVVIVDKNDHYTINVLNNKKRIVLNNEVFEVDSLCVFEVDGKTVIIYA